MPSVSTERVHFQIQGYLVHFFSFILFRIEIPVRRQCIPTSLIWVSTVYLCPKKGTLSTNGLTSAFLRGSSIMIPLWHFTWHAGLHSAVGSASDCRSRPGSWVWGPARPHNLRGAWYFLLSFSPFSWFKKGSCQLLADVCPPTTG